MPQSAVFFLFFLWILQSVSAEFEKCQESTPCACKLNDQDETYIDLSTVGRSDGLARFVVLYKNSKDVSLLYSYNPCHPISYSTQNFEVEYGQPGCTDAAACIITPGNMSGSSPTQRAIGYQDSATFFHDSNNVKINYSVSEDVNLTVTLKCDPSVQYKLEINNETSFILSTWCACGNEISKDKCRVASPNAKSGLSTGSILLITFFVILLVYVGFGILFNFCKGAHGTELFPNFEFWNELPKLIVDGFLFTCSCFGRRTSYSDV